MLKASFTAANQMKQHDQWCVAASEVVNTVYGTSDAKLWYNLFKGYKGEKNGVPYNVGGSRVFTYADALQYYGLTDGVNRYKSVYTQVSTYLTELNPFDFNSQVDAVTSYEDAVNLYYLKNIEDVDAGTAYKASYDETKTELMASGEWAVNFATGSSEILPTSTATLNELYNILIQAEDSKLVIEGHTDNVGQPQANLNLSKSRAESVVEYLISRGIPETRFTNGGTRQVFGKGQTEPIADNSTKKGQATNRRVVVKLLN
jgi:outer membrane protein OmpA-like peptidoglycan-associated protein